MKKILLVLCALCFICAGNFESFAQKRKAVKKPVKRKLLKCRVDGKIVYRTKCPTPTILPGTQTSTTNRTPDEPYGIVSSEGAGTGGGMGNGRGTGQGYGIGSGSGNGNIEPETTVKPESRVKPIGPTMAIKITSKPQPRYTDAARKNNVQGRIRLKVTFSANGAIGAITPINSLPYGLTEQAVAAARMIRFEPAKKNGVPYTVVKIIEYSFTIY